ncbi:viral A-type inclusion protein, partial [Trypanosoma grayi]|uniref:viral A-type inclusion protein n=1 Tax=Trypanosoma grayi TaxID=71804 RepID=UPI0004F46B42
MDDISQVVKNYYAVIGQKDEDIFELYRDNRRLQKELDEANAAGEEAEAERSTLKLLVAALQTEVREKQALIDAHAAESAPLRSAMWRARDLLQMPSELDYTAEDVIDACVNLHSECRELRVQRQQLADTAMGGWSLACRTLIESEQLRRGALVDACDGANASMVRLLQRIRQAEVEQQLLREMCEEADRERCREVELLAKRAQVELRQQERLVEELQERVASADRRVQLLEQQVQQEQAEKELLVEAACTRLDLMVERCADAERMLAIALRYLFRCGKQLQESTSEVAALQGKNEKLQSNLSHARALLRRKQKQPQQEQQQSRLDMSGVADDAQSEMSPHLGPQPQRGEKYHDNGGAFRALQMEHESLKMEWRRCVERERAARHQAAASASRMKAERTACEAADAECQRRCATLEAALHR